MSTVPLFRADPYRKVANATVVAVTEEGGIILDQSIFYPLGGGQPGDSGFLNWPGASLRITNTVKGEGETIVLLPAEGSALPKVGQTVEMMLDWERRYSLMRVHTALHLLSVAIPFGVTGGSISEGKGRLDFEMPEPPEDKEAVARELNRMISSDLVVSEDWITEAELDAQPDLVKTMKVKPPRGAGRVRLIRIGNATAPLDLQPCGGTHVATLGEIGAVRLGKVEKKGRMNRRVYLHLDD